MITLIEYPAELTGSECDIKLTLAAGAGTCPVPATARRVGLKGSAAGVRVRLGSAPEAQNTKVTPAGIGDISAGVEIPSASEEFFILGGAISRTLHFKGAAAETVTIRFF